MFGEPIYWAAICRDCGWTGMSNECGGGNPIADTGDFDDITCPKCNSTHIDEASE